MSNLEFPSKEEANELAFDELMQAISMAGLCVTVSGDFRQMWIADIYEESKPLARACDVAKSARVALDGACEAWRERKP